MKRIWCRVIDYEYYTPINAPHPDCSLVLELECGHQDRRKASQGIPERVACYFCNQAEKQRRYNESS